MKQEGLVVVLLGPDIHNPTTAHVGGRAKFLSGVWGISALWGTITTSHPVSAAKTMSIVSCSGAGAHIQQGMERRLSKRCKC